jgi:hypothetical protein
VSLLLFTLCPPWLLALPAGSVVRLLSPEEATLAEGGLLPRPSAALGMLHSREGAYPALDLGRLLGLGDQRAAWVVLALSSETTVAAALRTGACPSVAALPGGSTTPLPAGLCPSRPGALAAAFSASAGPRLPARAAIAPVGLVLDLDSLLRADEREWIRRTGAPRLPSEGGEAAGEAAEAGA